ERLLGPWASDPARRAPRRGSPRGARARTRLEAPLRLRRRPHARALLPRSEVVAPSARRGPPGVARHGRRESRPPHPARQRNRPLRDPRLKLNRPSALQRREAAQRTRAVRLRRWSWLSEAWATRSVRLRARPPAVGRGKPGEPRCWAR